MLLIKIIAFAAILYLIKQLLYPYYRPVGKKQKNSTRIFEKNRRLEEIKRKRRVRKIALAELYAFRLPFMQSREALRKALHRLGLDKRPEEIWLEQDLALIGGLLLAVVALSGNIVLGLIVMMCIPVFYFIPTDELDKEVKRRNTNIALDFPQFYSMVFYQYSKSINVYLADVINDFLPNANDDMAEELNIMLQNIDFSDEEYALKQLKKRVPVYHIIKFCDIMETRLNGYDNVSRMQYLKNDLDRSRISELETELEKRIAKNNVIQTSIIIILGLYILIYYFITIIGSMEMFM